MQSESNNGGVSFGTMSAVLVIHNNYNLKVRTDRIISEILDVSRNRVKQLINKDIITLIEKGQEREI